MQSHFTAESSVLLYLCKELGLTVPSFKGYSSALNQVLSQMVKDLADKIICRMFSSFEKNCHLREIRPLERILALVPKSLIHLPHEPLKLSLVKHLMWKKTSL